MTEAWTIWQELNTPETPPVTRDPDLPPLVPGKPYWVDHPGLHRRSNPIVALAVGPDPSKPDHWVLVADTDWAGRYLSLPINDIGDQEGLSAPYDGSDDGV